MVKSLPLYPTTEEQEVLQKVIEDLYGAFFFHRLKEDREQEWISQNYKLCDELGIWFDSGCTKFIIGLKDFDWIIKVTIPSVVLERGRDYAKEESEVFNDAFVAGLNQYFAPTYDFGRIAGLPLVIQHRAECNEDYYYDLFWEYCESGFDRSDYEDEDDFISAVDEDVGCIDVESAMYAVFDDVPQKLIDFVSEHNLNDFHSRNFGEINECPVLIDFCGY